MIKDDANKVLAALETNRVMARDSDGNYTREITPAKITEAIAIMRREVEQPEISDAEIEALAATHGSRYTNRHFVGQSSYGFHNAGLRAFARALLEKTK